MNRPVIVKLISAFVFARWIEQFCCLLNPKFSASSYLLCLYSSMFVEPVRKTHCWFSRDVAHCLFKQHNMKCILTINAKSLQLEVSSLCLRKSTYMDIMMSDFPIKYQEFPSLLSHSHYMQNEIYILDFRCII